MKLEEINRAVAVLQSGDLVAFPTETVYGLGADAKNPAALRKIFLAKQRPMDHPLIVHLGNSDELTQWAVDISADAKRLAAAFWPGPLTLILKKAPGVSDLITGNQATIGLRVPQHPVAQALLKAFGGGLAAPSANRFGQISPTSAQAVREELGDVVTCILEGGACEVGVESTIIDMSGEQPVILRPGMITVKQIENVLQKSVGTPEKNSPRVSGSLELHYSPRTKTRLMSAEDIPKYLQSLSGMQLPIGLLVREKVVSENPQVHCVVMPQDVKEYAHDLYRVLRLMDKENYREIVIERVPEGVEWDGVRDRVSRMG